MALILATVLGADSIDDCDVLRAGRTRRLLGGWLPAPSTLRNILRRSRSGMSASSTRCSARHWSGHGRRAPVQGEGRLIVDVDSFVGEVCGRLKQGASYGYTELLGSPPDPRDPRGRPGGALHVRLRKGSANTQQEVLGFSEELIARIQQEPARLA